MIELGEGFDWRKPDYSAVYRERARRLARMRGGSAEENAAMVAGLKEWYRERPVDFITDWGMTYDPRNVEIGLDAVTPFVLFPRQAEFVEWLYARWRNREDGLCEKSRDVGISWLSSGFGGWMWLFHANTAIGFGSRKEEYVDSVGDPKSLLWKVRQFINLVPEEFKPDGYDERIHAPRMRIMNPENGSIIFGEAGMNIGRGARASFYIKDESAHYEHAEMIDAALSMTSNCKIDMSSVNGEGNAFARKRFGGNIPVFTFKWQEDPRKDQAWYDDQKRKLDPMILAQEIDIDYMASVSNSYIDSSYVTDAMNAQVKDVDAIGEWIIGVDAAHEGNDESIIHARRGRFNMDQRVFNKLDGHDLAAEVDAWGSQLARSSGVGVAGIVIELDGPGTSAYDCLKRGPFGDKVRGIHTGIKLRDNYNYNLRAKLWSSALEYLKEGGIRMAHDPKMKMQIAAMRYGYKDGLLLMMDKKTYKKEFGFSPDRADAFMLTFAPIRDAASRKNSSMSIKIGYESRKKRFR